MTESTPVGRRRAPLDPRELVRLSAPMAIGAAIGGLLALAGVKASSITIAVSAGGSGVAVSLLLLRHKVPLAYVINWSLLLGATLATTLILVGGT